MNYSPKLKTAMEEIKAVVKKHDIAALVVLHTPEFSEYLFAIDPTYSAMRFTDRPGEIRIKTDSKEMGKEVAEKFAQDTSNMITHFQDQLDAMSTMIDYLAGILDRVWKTERIEGKRTDHNQQNN
jgi:hypothetical protein